MPSPSKRRTLSGFETIHETADHVPEKRFAESSLPLRPLNVVSGVVQAVASRDTLHRKMTQAKRPPGTPGTLPAVSVPDAWQEFALTEPYFSVITNPKF